MSHSSTKVILIAGTNGKTTSSLMLKTVLEADGKTVLHNESGANLLNGIASTLLKEITPMGKVREDYAIFEVDENALPRVLKSVTPDYVVLLNLFRDQLDRYGEVATVMEKWQQSFSKLPNKTVLVVNADDPKTAYLGMERKNTLFFGLASNSDKKSSEPEAADSNYCPRCHHKLTYTAVTYSHLGNWHCSSCKLRRPDINISNDINLSLSGTYNLYNAHGIIALSHDIGTHTSVIAKALKEVKPAFGRQEKISYSGKNIQLFLSKNPTGFNESLKTIHEAHAKHLLIVLNDNFADGTDVSWIWDIDLEKFLTSFSAITISGTRCYDMALRIYYAKGEGHSAKSIQIEESIEKALHGALKDLPDEETLYVLPTYTAMLDVRKMLTGKKIL